MAGFTTKKRSREELPRPKGRPVKKRKQQFEYHSDSDDEGGGAADGQDFKAVNLLDSDEDLENMVADDGASSGSDDSSSDNDDSRQNPKPKSQQQPKSKPKSSKLAAARAKDDFEDELNDDDDDDDEDTDEPSSSGEDEDDDNEEGGAPTGPRRKQSKRNDPAAFATSMSKILSTKLSGARKADPVLSRSTSALEASRRAADTALEAKARRKLVEQRRVALEKGRVRDVLVATNLPTAFHKTSSAAGGGVGGNDAETIMTTSELLEAERRLRKVAQRGVIKLFNAVRAAQVKASEAERATRAQGVLGIGKRQEKVAEMSKKGFLDLIAGGGGGLKKGPLEEA